MSTETNTPPAPPAPALDGAPPAPPAPAGGNPAATGIELPPADKVTLPSDQQLLAGKYKTPEDLQKGYDALVDKLQLKGAVRDKFDKPEDQVAAYKVLEARLGAKPPEPPKTETPPAPPAVPVRTVEELVTKAGLDSVALGEQWTKEGKLTDEQYTALTKTVPGLSKELVDQVIGQQFALAVQRQQQAKATAVAIVGGEQQLQTLLSFGRSLPEPVQADIESRLRDFGKMEGAILELQQRFLQAAKTGGSNPLINGTMSGVGATVYASNAEMDADMNDPRYGKDANFTAAVRAKFARSDRAGTINPGRIV